MSYFGAKSNASPGNHGQGRHASGGEPNNPHRAVRQILRSLASGTTVAEVGRLVGYSDREIYRRLRKVYRKLGVKCRVDALVKASR